MRPSVLNAAALGTFAFAFLVPAEFLVDRLAARMARRMSQKGAVPLSFVPAWRTGAWLLRRDPMAENEVERLHRLQVLVNLFLMVGLGMSFAKRRERLAVPVPWEQHGSASPSLVS